LVVVGVDLLRSREERERGRIIVRGWELRGRWGYLFIKIFALGL
jgi:hypothetical protein